MMCEIILLCFVRAPSIDEYTQLVIVKTFSIKPTFYRVSNLFRYFFFAQKGHLLPKTHNSQNRCGFERVRFLLHDNAMEEKCTVICWEWLCEVEGTGILSSTSIIWRSTGPPSTFELSTGMKTSPVLFKSDESIMHSYKYLQVKKP
ncbi:hypothetical protein YC2023_024389 [Brassica napus]